MHYKYEASSLLINFVTLIETQFHVRIKQIRLENAKELAIIDFSHSICRAARAEFSCGTQAPTPP